MPTLPLSALLAMAICAFATLGLLWAEARQARAPRAAFKTVASSAFIAVALAADAAATPYGRLILIALVLSWLGDVLLLAHRSAVFLAGLGAFLLAHVVYAGAFAGGPLHGGALLAGAALMFVVGVLVLRAFWPRLKTPYRIAVPAYVVAIGAMCTLAIGAGVGSGAWWLAVAALAFAASDISVARDRFIGHALANKAWGLPLYYAAQLTLAASVARPA
ncbi:lysoplasmalogenase [Aerolutibacter daejeonensis]|uniref:lysoplasmalogenase n=1 Tax=Aerolutibacter daejeonensis TaxID=346181 RepID=UPI0018DCF9B8|nr:lysoplasmalogenase [Lysobacter daejeonensis]